MQLSQNQPYSFTLIKSRSASDLHYRYFLNLYKSTPKDIKNTDYNILFLICDNFICNPFIPQSKESITALCYDEHCKEYYPTLNMEYWKYVSKNTIGNSTVFSYKRITSRSCEEINHSL